MIDGESVDRTVIIPLLGTDLKRNGTWVMTWCPAHNDGAKNGRGRGMKGRSLGLSDDGVLKCFAGCDFKSLAEALGIPKDGGKPDSNVTPFRPKPTGPRPPDLSRGEVVASVYEYRDMGGKLIAEKARIETTGTAGKRFMWRMPGVQGWPGIAYGGGLQGLQMEDMPLWGSELVATADPKEWVFFVEGEKAAEACRQRGFLTVTHGGGSSTRRFGGSLEILRDRRVALWADNDEPGKRYMSVVAGALGKIARQVRHISVPLPEKGDAFDYFAEGGKPEDVFKTTWDKPLIEYLGLDHVRVTTYTTLGPVLFDFDEMTHGRKALDCELTITPLTPGMDDEPYVQGHNLLSASGREGLERVLKKQFGDTNWTMAISQAFTRARESFNAQDRATHYANITEREIQYLLAPWIPLGQHSIIFGDGSSGKTMLAYQIALAVALGSPLFGSQVEQAGVVIVDYETDESVSRKRMRRLLEGMGYSPSFIEQLNIHYWPAGGIPLHEQADALRRFAKKHDVRFMVVDSGGVACGGPPEKSESALGYFAGCSRTGIETVLTICHITHQSEGLYPFGSKFWHNLARRTYFMKANGIGSDNMELSFHPRKANEVRLQPSTSFALDFDGDEGPIKLSVGQMRVVPVWQDLDMLDRAWLYLRENPGLKQWELGKELGLVATEAQALLNTNPDIFELGYNATVNGNVRIWYARGDEPPSERAM